MCEMQPSPLKKPFFLHHPLELRAVLITIFRQGVLYPCRWKFWKYFLKAMFRFQKCRFDQFVAVCVMGEHYFEFRNTVKEKLLEKLKREGHLLRPTSSPVKAKGTDSDLLSRAAKS